MTAFQTHMEDELANLMKQRTILNVKRKKRALCQEIQNHLPQMEQEIEKIEISNVLKCAEYKHQLR